MSAYLWHSICVPAGVVVVVTGVVVEEVVAEIPQDSTQFGRKNALSALYFVKLTLRVKLKTSRPKRASQATSVTCCSSCSSGCCWNWSRCRTCCCKTY